MTRGGEVEENTADDIDVVLVAARDAMVNAYSPYTGVKVGAALLSAEGSVFAGCSVESAEPGASIAASAAALAHAVAHGARSFERLVVVTETGPPRFPGGPARQALHEFSPNMTVVAETTEGERMLSTLSELLPHAVRRKAGG